MYTHQFNSPFTDDSNVLVVSRTEIRMIALNEDEPFVDVQVPIDLNEIEAVFVAYDFVREKVRIS